MGGLFLAQDESWWHATGLPGPWALSEAETGAPTPRDAGVTSNVGFLMQFQVKSHFEGQISKKRQSNYTECNMHQ